MPSHTAYKQMCCRKLCVGDGQTGESDFISGLRAVPKTLQLTASRCSHHIPSFLPFSSFPKTGNLTCALVNESCKCGRNSKCFSVYFSHFFCIYLITSSVLFFNKYPVFSIPNAEREICRKETGAAH